LRNVFEAVDFTAATAAYLNQPVARRQARKTDRAKRVNRAPRWTRRGHN